MRQKTRITNTEGIIRDVIILSGTTAALGHFLLYTFLGKRGVLRELCGRLLITPPGHAGEEEEEEPGAGQGLGLQLNPAHKLPLESSQSVNQSNARSPSQTFG